MPSVNGTIPIGEYLNEEFQMFGADTLGADYGVLLSRLKKFLCGGRTPFVPGVANVGVGTVHSFKITDGSLMTTETWNIIFTSSTAIDLIGSTSGNVGTFALAAPVEGDYDTAGLVGPGFTLQVTQGPTAFATGDFFSFDTEASPLGADAYSVEMDSAEGVGCSIRVVEELYRYSPSAGVNYLFEAFGQYAAPSVLDDGEFPAAVSKIYFYDQDSLNRTFYIDFHTATEYKLKDSAGVVLANGELGTLLDYRSPTFSVGIKIEKTVRSPYHHANAAINGIPPTNKSGNASGLPSTARTSMKFAPAYVDEVSPTRVTRVMTLKSSGVISSDERYYTLAQRVGGVGNGNRWYLECQLSPGYSALDGVFNQSGTSPAARIINHQGAISDYVLIGDPRSFKCLVKITGDYQTLCAGLFIPHSMPSSYPWPAFVLGTVGNGDVASIIATAPSRNDHGPGYNPGGASMAADSNGYTFGSNLWVCLPTGQWVPGANRTGAGNVIGLVGSYSKNLNETADNFDAVYTAPWIYRDGADDPGGARHLSRISCNAFRDPAVKVLLPGAILFGSSTLRGFLGEFPGIFFTGQSNESPIVPGDVVNALTNGVAVTDHIVWSATVVAPANAAVLAAYDIS